MSFVMTYDDRNRREISTLAPNTKVAALKFYQYCIDHQVQILITEGIRSLAEQKQNVAKGVSQTLQSYHLVGQAFDFVPVVNGKIDYSLYKTSPWKDAVAYAKTIGFEWGGDWTSLVDQPHLQFTYKGYGTDKVLDAQKVSVASSTPKKTYTSIVDYLNDHGKDSSFTARMKLAATYGIFGYTGTAEQNMKLLAKVQG